MLRLDKYLADMGICTRSEAKKLLKCSFVAVNGKTEKDPSTKVDPKKDSVTFKGEKISYQKYFYYMLNKPAGCVSATRDGLSETVIEFLKGEPTRDLFPVGRLDKDTEGFLLITNDGMLAHNLLSPKKHVNKTYFAFVDKPLSDSEIESFKTGLDIGDETPTLPAGLEVINNDEAKAFLEGATALAMEDFKYEAAYKVTLKEGRYHQIKRMFEHFGSLVTYLKRVSMGPLYLDDSLKPGEYRQLTVEEVTDLQNANN